MAQEAKRFKSDSTQITLAIRTIIEALPQHETTSNWLAICKATQCIEVPCRTNYADATRNNLSWFEKLGSNCFDLCPYAVRSGDISLLGHCGTLLNWNFVGDFKKKVGKAISKSKWFFEETCFKGHFDHYIKFKYALRGATQATSPLLLKKVFQLSDTDLENAIQHRKFKFFEWCIEDEIIINISDECLQKLIPTGNLSLLKRMVKAKWISNEQRKTIGRLALYYNQTAIFKWAHKKGFVKLHRSTIYWDIDLELFNIAYENYWSSEDYVGWAIPSYWLKRGDFVRFDAHWKDHGPKLVGQCFPFLLNSNRYTHEQLKDFAERQNEVHKRIEADVHMLSALKSFGILHKFRYKLFGPGLEPWLPQFAPVRISNFYPENFDFNDESLLEYLDFHIRPHEQEELTNRVDLRHAHLWRKIFSYGPWFEMHFMELQNYEFGNWLLQYPDLLASSGLTDCWQTIESPEAFVFFWRDLKIPTKHVTMLTYDIFSIMTDEEMLQYGITNCFDRARENFSQHQYLQAVQRLNQIAKNALNQKIGN